MYVVCVCADLNGVKHNMEIAFPVKPSLDELLSETERLFQLELWMQTPVGDVPQRTRAFKIKKFVIYDEALHRWSDLQFTSQLRPWAQLYATQQVSSPSTTSSLSSSEGRSVEGGKYRTVPSQHRGFDTADAESVEDDDDPLRDDPDLPASERLRRSLQRESLLRKHLGDRPSLSRSPASPRKHSSPSPRSDRPPSGELPSANARYTVQDSGLSRSGSEDVRQMMMDEQAILSQEARIRAQRDALAVQESQLLRDREEFIARNGRLPGAKKEAEQANAFRAKREKFQLSRR